MPPTTFTDNFNRANEFPLGNRLSQGGTNEDVWGIVFRKIDANGVNIFWMRPNLRDQQVDDRSDDLQWKMAYYKDVNFKTDQSLDVRITLTQIPQGGDTAGFGISLLVNKTNGTGYLGTISYSGASTPTNGGPNRTAIVIYNVLDIPAGSTGIAFANAAGNSVAPGLVMQFKYDGVDLLTWGTLSGSLSVSVNDSSIVKGKSVGFGLYSYGFIVPRNRPVWSAIDDFQVTGTVDPPTANTLAPTNCVCSGRY